MPTFNGSDDPHEFVRWFNSELQFPSEAIRDSFDGRVIAYYVVDSTGSVVDPLFLDSIPPYIKAEIERVLLSSPKWTPGVYKGKPVNTMFSIPVTFNFFGIDKRDEPIIEPSKKEQRKRRSKTTANKRVTSICQVTFLRMINYTGNNQYNQKCAP
jgi:hypothetical protein